MYLVFIGIAFTSMQRFPLDSSIVFSEFTMSEGDSCSSLLVTSPRATDEGTHLDDWLPVDGRNLFGEVSTPKKVCAAPSYDPSFDMSVGLQSLIGLPQDFCEALDKLGVVV